MLVWPEFIEIAKLCPKTIMPFYHNYTILKHEAQYDELDLNEKSSSRVKTTTSSKAIT